jgi:phage-related protein
MPGNVAAAAPATVLPVTLSCAFSEGREFPMVESGPYPDGASQRRKDAAYSRKSWSVTRRLTAGEWTTLIAFWNARKGSLEPFYYYPDAADHDPTGASATGRAIVRFDAALSRAMMLARSQSEVRLVQID